MSDEERVSTEDWRMILMGEHPDMRRERRVFRHIPSDPRCKMCLAPQGGIGGPIMRLLGYGRYPPNPQLCNSCYRQSVKHPGGAEIEITALFADGPRAAPPRASRPERAARRVGRGGDNRRRVTRPRSAIGPTGFEPVRPAGSPRTLRAARPAPGARPPSRTASRACDPQRRRCRRQAAGRLRHGEDAHAADGPPFVERAASARPRTSPQPAHRDGPIPRSTMPHRSHRRAPGARAQKRTRRQLPTTPP